LANTWGGSNLVITLDQPYEINCIGIGYTNARELTLIFNPIQLLDIEGNTTNPEYTYEGGIDFVDYELDIESNLITAEGASEQRIMFSGNGLYRIMPVVTDKITIKTDGSYIGRFAAGIAVDLPTSIAKEPGWASTAKYRKTLSGQIIPGAGGYTYRTLSVDVRYKIDRYDLSQIEMAYNGQIGLGYPYFLLFDKEAYRLPFVRLYAKDLKTDQYVFQGGIARPLFSRKFEFEECF
jgi:hypothetical protein